MSKHATFHAVCDAFGKYFEIAPAHVHAHHQLRSDWGLDSLELEWLVQQIEASTGIELEDYHALHRLETVGQLARLFRTA